MLILDAAAVSRALPMAECISAMERALAGFSDGTYWQPPRQQLRPEGGSSVMGMMPAYRVGAKPLWGFKHIIVAPDNHRRGLSSHQGAVLLNDGETGELLALVDATTLTALRTAAVSAVATRTLARPDAARVAIIGTGAQARSHVEAMRLVLPDAYITIAGRSAEKSQHLAQDLNVEAASSIYAAVIQADVICTTTASRTPIVRHEWVRPGCHVNVVGSSDPAAREIDGALVGASEFFIDSHAQMQVECGEYLLAIEEGSLDPNTPCTELGDVLVGRCPGRSAAEAITVFKSLGLAVEDLVAAEVAVHRAREMLDGVEVDWARR